MNNSKFALDSFEMEKSTVVDVTPMLREEESNLVNVIEALNEVSQSKGWSSLKNRVFDGVVEKLEKDLLSEAKKDDRDLIKQASLTGQLVWAKKYSDLDGLTEVYRQRLTNVRKQLGQ